MKIDDVVCPEDIRKGGFRQRFSRSSPPVDRSGKAENKRHGILIYLIISCSYDIISDHRPVEDKCHSLVTAANPAGGGKLHPHLDNRSRQDRAFRG
ncbi:hypothetical protein [Pseudogemmobacter bohemicus]|uniref:hypothetical protein n=1 Tax=Pseudogemmobacter bohemicus TaxID=2250708 RepID=UPI001E3A33D5|nr:hypothetical protein [Pseudogemmobacter bohemicus]